MGLRPTLELPFYPVKDRLTLAESRAPSSAPEKLPGLCGEAWVVKKWPGRPGFEHGEHGHTHACIYLLCT